LPVIAVSSYVPAYAASGGPPTVQVLAACKQSGGSCNPPFLKGYTFLVQFTNNSNKTVYIYTASTGQYSPYFAVTGSNGQQFLYGTAQLFNVGPPPTIAGPVPGDALPVPANSAVQIYVDAGPGNNSAQSSATGSVFFAWGHTMVAGADPDHPYTPAPPTTPPGEGWVGAPVSIASFNPCKNSLSGGGGPGCLP
jgi:hypothetical protein